MQYSKILVTGATGYIGGRLLQRLIERDLSVRCLVRRSTKLSQVESNNLEIQQGNLLDFASLREAFNGIDVAYYLVHSLGSSKNFEEKETRCAKNFIRVASEAKVKRIVYLGGLAETSDPSPHLRSRKQVGEILRSSNIPCIELQASIIIGSGSVSFEMIRNLVDRLPIMITPKWVRSKAQPISIEDVLDYLIWSATIETSSSQIYQIGGPDVVSYQDIMMVYAKERGLRRFMIPVPVLTTRLSSLWLGLVTPLYARVGRKLIDSVKNSSTVTDPKILEHSSVRPRGLVESVRQAIRKEDREFEGTKWSGALSSAGEAPSWGGTKFKNRLIDSRSCVVQTSISRAFLPIKAIGGENGWYYANWAWNLRGLADLLIGGVGVRRGKSSYQEIHVGDHLDFWRVEAFEMNRLLRLSAEMKVPGRAWLQFEVNSVGDNLVKITQTAVFDPLGLWGLIYWYALYPAHSLIFSGMLKQIAKRAESQYSGS